MSDEIISHGWTSEITVNIMECLGIGQDEINSELRMESDSYRMDGEEAEERRLPNSDYVKEKMGLDNSEISIREIKFKWNEVSSSYSGEKRGVLYVEASNPINYIVIFNDGGKVENL